MQEFAVRPRPPAVSVTRRALAVQRCGDHPCPPSGCNKEEEQRLSRSPTGPAPDVAPPVVHEVIGSPGEPLPASLNEGMSARFGHDFARVRVHTGPRAAESAASVAARAYTVGPHVVLGRSAPDLHSPDGQRLLAHELTHVIQQPAAVPGGELPISSPGDAGEREAAAAATRVVPSSAPPRGTRAGRQVSAPALGHVGQQDGSRGQGVARLQRLSFSDVLEFGAEVSGQPVVAQVVHAEKQVIDDLVASVRESPEHVMEFFEDEVWEQIKANWPQIIAVTLGLMAVEGAVAFLGAIPEPTMLTKVVAAILQIIVLAVLGYFAAVELKGVYEEGRRWLTLVGQAKGQAQQISEASRAFVRMVWHIVLAVLLVAGVRARIRGLSGSAEAAGAGRVGGSGTGGAGAEGGDVTPISSHPRYQPRFPSQAEPSPAQPSASAFGPGNTARQLAPAEAPLPRPAPDLPPAPRPRPAPAPKAPKVGPGVQVPPAVAAGMSSGTRHPRKSSQLASAPKAQPGPQPQTRPAKRHPKQKDDCSNELYDELRGKITACKRVSFSCSEAAERAALGITTRKAFDKPGAPRWPREEILRRLALAEECAKARDDFQRECFEEAPDDPEWRDHERQRREWKEAAQRCRDIARKRGYLP